MKRVTTGEKGYDRGASTTVTELGDRLVNGEPRESTSRVLCFSASGGKGLGAVVAAKRSWRGGASALFCARRSSRRDRAKTSPFLSPRCLKS